MNTDEKKNETRLSPNTVAMLSYSLPPLSGIYFFIFEKRDGEPPNQFVLFHVYQSIMFGVAAYLLVKITSFLPYTIGYFVSKTTAVAMILLWIFLMLKAHSGSEFQLPYIGRLAKKQAEKTLQ